MERNRSSQLISLSTFVKPEQLGNDVVIVVYIHLIQLRLTSTI